MPTKYAGSCHCGDVAFQAEGEIAELKRCGIQPFAFAADPKGNEMAAINVRTLEDVNLTDFPRKAFNGKAL